MPPRFCFSYLENTSMLCVGEMYMFCCYTAQCGVKPESLQTARDGTSTGTSAYLWSHSPRKTMAPFTGKCRSSHTQPSVRNSPSHSLGSERKGCSSQDRRHQIIRYSPREVLRPNVQHWQGKASTATATALQKGVYLFKPKEQLCRPRSGFPDSQRDHDGRCRNDRLGEPFS